MFVSFSRPSGGSESDESESEASAEEESSVFVERKKEVPVTECCLEHKEERVLENILDETTLSLCLEFLDPMAWCLIGGACRATRRVSDARWLEFSKVFCEGHSSASAAKRWFVAQVNRRRAADAAEGHQASCLPSLGREIKNDEVKFFLRLKADGVLAWEGDTVAHFELNEGHECIGLDVGSDSFASLRKGMIFERRKTGLRLVSQQIEATLVAVRSCDQKALPFASFRSIKSGPLLLSSEPIQSLRPDFVASGLTEARLGIDIFDFVDEAPSADFLGNSGQKSTDRIAGIQACLTPSLKNRGRLLLFFSWGFLCDHDDGHFLDDRDLDHNEIVTLLQALQWENTS